jgi:hypothetical protein
MKRKEGKEVWREEGRKDRERKKEKGKKENSINK